ncbi:alpha/beta hydrolase-fold protein [Pseudonocardia ailaonensis]|uniref:Alpha/beta hydrolase-fold protein n=1 Tax=Pseudonocardia ailaonensis TaxID=367279 RepID=A0ABN2MVG3_9PSEU
MRALLLDSPLILGWLPTTLTVLGGVALLFLLVRPGTRWWTRRVPAALAVALVVLGLAEVGLLVWQPFPDALPWRIWVWGGVGLVGLGLGIANLARSRWWRRVLVVPAVLLVVAASAVKINAVYAYRPTLAAAIGIPPANAIDFATVPRALPEAPRGPDGTVGSGWTAPGGMPHGGRIATVDIPGRISGFAARPGSVYLPPAYFADPRPLLPVLVLVAGQPGDPQDWLVAGELASVMDRFAADHGGLAPIVVLPDATGTAFANPLCLDSKLGAVETYLAQDVPAWVSANLQADDAQRAIGGFSYGGTCALQLATRRPAEYPTFLDISGQAEPSLGNHDQTVAATFGDRPDPEAAYRAANPLDILPQVKGIAGRLVVGADDPDYGPQARRVVDAGRAAGLDFGLVEVPGTHSWAVAVAGLGRQLAWVSERTRLLPVPPGGPA